MRCSAWQGVDVQAAQLPEPIEDFGALAELADNAVVPLGWDSCALVHVVLTARRPNALANSGASRPGEGIPGRSTPATAPGR